MNHEERVHFFRNELEKARRDFPKSSTEVKTAANCYQAALSESVSHGSPAIRGSDVGLSDHSKVVLSCDGVNVAALFSDSGARVGNAQVFTCKEAVELGQKISDTGVYDGLPIDDLSHSVVKAFGKRLKEYGENHR